MENIKMREENILVNQEQRQLVTNSEYINRYPNLKEILTKYEKIKRSDLDNGEFSEELKNILLYSFNEIVEQASEEWYVPNKEPNYKSKPIPCSLCNTPNKYIYFIKNRINGIELNVGSECIKKFKKIQMVGTKSLDTLKRATYAHEAKIRRITEFNNKYPNAKNIIANWRYEFDNLEVVMPKQIQDEFNKIYNEAKNLYDSCIKENLKQHQIDDFGNLIKQYDLLSIKVKEIVSKNKNNPLACSYRIKKWLEDTHQYALFNEISENYGLITKQTINRIYHEDFVSGFWNEYKKYINEAGFIVEGFDGKIISLSYTTVVRHNIYKLECNIKDFMAKFGQILFEKNANIRTDELMKISKLVYTEENYLNIYDFYNFYLQRNKFEIELDFSKNRIEHINKKKNTYSMGIASAFADYHKRLLLLNENEIKEGLLKTIKRFTFKPLSEKEKYEVDERMISRNPSYRK